MNKILVATDPEFFLQDTCGNIVSAAGLLGCDKYSKADLCKGARLQEDNVLLEFDIDPHDNLKDLRDQIGLAMSASNKIANSFGLELNLTKCSHIFTGEELSKFPKSAMEFGCNADYNAFTGMINPKPRSADPGLRTAGGHVHIGYSHLSEVTEMNQRIIGVMCDYLLGLESLLLDEDDLRRELYGKAGAIRMKDYGIEYRTLSNFWLRKPNHLDWVFDKVHKAYELGISDGYQDAIATISPEEIQRVINMNDKRLAEEYIRRLEGL